MQMGLGQLRLSPSVFYDMTMEEFLAAVGGFHRHEEMLQRQEWERTRWLAACLLAPHGKQGQRIKPTDLATFPWEKATKSRNDNRLLRQALNRMNNGKA